MQIRPGSGRGGSQSIYAGNLTNEPAAQCDGPCLRCPSANINKVHGGGDGKHSIGRMLTCLLLGQRPTLEAVWTTRIINGPRSLDGATILLNVIILTDG